MLALWSGLLSGVLATKMGSTAGFYDGLAEAYDGIFADWEGSVRRQGEAVEGLLEGRRGRILDCSCGIGTQALGLAMRGVEVQGTDLSEKSIERARREADRLGLDVRFEVADMRQLRFDDPFDAIVSFDNALPHLLTDDDLRLALSRIFDSLRPGGLFVASIRDYDRLLLEKPTSNSFRAMPDASGKQRASFQLWHWSGDVYDVTQFVIAPSGGDEWSTIHATGRYRALRRAELDAALRAVGFEDLRWFLPETHPGLYFQPVIKASRPDSPGAPRE
mmetsp:Transcript_6543/g.19885  ORF Transcript_6543/g.19885 Transcript_6543/m.19885 type:complete len:276 (-) Transcript_6543:270-1097(-)